ncbi:uncharacterized protein [Rutidosis leptorrhynchoides]|uniref:uncharacterized protein n=1 Tax=Rutidosis leptorrhynchoides TaxID=125765 RepID=UPI003A996380
MWLGNHVLEESFGRLFRLELNQEVLVQNRLIKNGNNWSAFWEWSRTPTGRTQAQFEELQALLSSFKYGENESDTWKWILQPNERFSTNALTKLINEKLVPDPSVNIKYVRNPFLPEKIGLLIWRVIMRRIPVRVELDKRGIDLDSVRCPVCDNDVETVDHIMFQCSFAKDIWNRVSRWCKFGNIQCMNSSEIFQGKKDPSRADSYSSLWQAIVWVTGYMIWQNRNLTVFKKKKGNGPMGLNEIQIKAFEWISNRSRKKMFEWNQWLMNPMYFDDHG